MLKRFTSIRKRKEENGVVHDGANGTNGHVLNGTSNANGISEVKHTNGTAQTSPKPSAKKRFSFGPKRQQSVTEQEVDRQGIDKAFEQFAQLVHAARRPLPTQTGDGSYIEHEIPSSLFEDIKSLGFKDVKTLREVMQSKGHLQDDKTMLMERVIQLVSALPSTSQHRKDLTNSFITELWDSLEHPPMSYLGEKFRYRQADGSHNNALFPELGKAGTPYARSVRPGTIQPGARPDPGLIFDSLFARPKGTFKEHPNRVSSILYYWASLIIHDLFQTDHRDFNISQTSSYLDLSTLYGDDQADQNNIRTFKDGKIKPDCFMEQRVLGMPPACGVILIMFNRFHNYVAEQLAAINEDGRFNKPGDNLSADASEKAWAKYDNDLFNTARLVTCGLYMNITLLDYLRTIVNLNRSNTTWTLDPRNEMGRKILGETAAPRGGGNQVSCEFNLVYRWHSSISKNDEAWTQAVYQKLLGKNGEDVSMPELLKGLGMWARTLDPDPTKREFGGLKRGEDGKFDDGDLVHLLANAIEDVAGCPGANHVPKVLRAAEILGIEQARHWNCASLNEFRKFFGLAPHESFESINKDPKVADTLKHLYEHPDFVELYPGIVCEDAKMPMVPGICPTYTVSRAILSDAVTLVRSDRHYTIDYHPKALTNWGYKEVQYDLNVEQGCVFYKLFLRAFPNHFKPNSIYAHFPMTIPSENEKIMRDLGRWAHYNYERPALIEPRINLTSLAGAKYMLNNAQQFKVTWGTATGAIMGKGGFDFMLSGDTPFHAQQKETMAKALYHDDWHNQIKKFYEDITIRLLQENSFKVGDVNMVDIVRDVDNSAHCHFAANVFSLPMKTKENPNGVFTEHELYAIIALIFTAIFFDFEPTKSFPLRMAATKFAHKLGGLIEANVKATSITAPVSSIVDSFRENHNALHSYGVHMIRELLKSGLSIYEVAWSQILPVATAMIPNQAQVFTQMLDFYLTPENQHHWTAIQTLAEQNTSSSFTELMGYMMEGVRLNGTFGSYRESQVSTTIDDNGTPISVRTGSKVFCSFVSANRDPEQFPDPDTVNPSRPLESYIQYGIGPHRCLGMEASRVALTAMLSVVARLKNLRRAPGPQGELKKIPRPGGFYVYMTPEHGGYFPFPTTWKLCFDGEVPAGKK
ncbi:putative fatty acid oxygenase [Phaeomoniella chlamydospora]|uniref:Putative fatty acid oxygenase n=1 Tax=Phaeomoniella chlamydospora TaxID=158046 RepID=A0A0G2F3C2_PHACM|nr:putative fatty acid oxygenase [Phaeomoniella chlamydospora]